MVRLHVDHRAKKNSICRCGCRAGSAEMRMGGLPTTPNVDRYAVTFTSPSTSSLGAMPVGNGRVAVNVWADRASGDVVLLIGLADALDENGILLKLGRVRLALDPPLLQPGQPFNQTLELSTGTVRVSTPTASVAVWVDANTSAVRARVVPPSGTAVRVWATLDHSARLAGTINATDFDPVGWGGWHGSYCKTTGDFATFVGIFPDVLRSGPGSVGWYHRNDAGRADFFGDATRQQGLGGCRETSWDPLTNRSWGGALVGGAGFSSLNRTALVSDATTAPADVAIGVVSAQTTEAAFIAALDATAAATRTDLQQRPPRDGGPTRRGGISSGQEVYIHVGTTTPPPSPTPPPTPPGPTGYSRYSGTVGDQGALMRNASWPANGESPITCSEPFNPNDPQDSCAAASARACTSLPGCVSFGLAPSWHGGRNPQAYTDGVAAATPNGAWTYFANGSAHLAPSTHLSAGELVSRQNVLMRYMDLCSSNRIGGGLDQTDFFAIKYNGGILTSEPDPYDNARGWGQGQWWQNLRLPYYAMLAEGGADIFRPLLRWYKNLLPLAECRTQQWFGRTDATGRSLHGVKGGWFIEAATQFGTFIPCELGYHCNDTRDANWTIDWAGNKAINLHREGSIELVMLALDYYSHTEDVAEFAETILPLAVGVTDFVASYYGKDANGKLEIWPTQSLEGYNPGGFPPTRNNTVRNDMPWVAGLHAVLPRLVALGSDAKVDPEQIARWQDLLDVLPPLPIAARGGVTVFTAAQTPYPPRAMLGGSEQPYMYAVHPYRLATAMTGGSMRQVGVDTITGQCPQPPCAPSYGTGWQQGVMNVALLGMASDAAAAVLERAATSSGAMRFPGYLPNMQDFRPNEDHLSNMRSALQYMILQHDTNGTIGLFPAWPCGNWSISFKLHAPRNTVLEGIFNHTTGTLALTVEPPSRRA
eukprot:CAMPEP_0206287244 /NCGR_PEP_ID=MMETSP0106_2-20121207/1009_1 /ASSEMBLY_ACC=CAM_ASM_000206 /TAXON_ID=81532 /ORGANISM="Acanthoeca-like sp., Strain 10tr" /LENGTH=932 /DNA_ID=CAMNT_0053717777 /DNA_START=54 /DNA_END=2849 /DNA_ORIENTATION=-